MINLSNRVIFQALECGPQPTVIADARKVDYVELFESHDAPRTIDYLQIDIEVSNGSTLETLEKLDETVMDRYRFATITFEHDIYRGDYFSTRKRSREIFGRRGYLLLFPDVRHEVIDNQSFEDWYVHPDLVDPDLVDRFKTDESLNYRTILNRMRGTEALGPGG